MRQSPKPGGQDMCQSVQRVQKGNHFPTPRSPASPSASGGSEKEEDLPSPLAEEPKEKHFKIFCGDTGYTYEAIFGEYLRGARVIDIEDPYIRSQHQIANVVQFCELVVKNGSVHTINLTSGFDDEIQRKEAENRFQNLASSLIEYGIKLNVTYNEHQHDREIRLENGWKIKIGRGFDIYQKPDNWFSVGVNDLELRPCLETIVDIFRID